jgi:hypothetical protein
MIRICKLKPDFYSFLKATHCILNLLFAIVDLSLNKKAEGEVGLRILQQTLKLNRP